MSVRATSTPRRSRKFYVSIVLLILIGIAVSGGLVWCTFPKEVHLYIYGPATTGSSTVTLWFNDEQIFVKSYPHPSYTLDPPDSDYIKASTVSTDFTIRATIGKLDETRTFSIFKGNVMDISFDSTIIIMTQGKTKPV